MDTFVSSNEALARQVMKAAAVFVILLCGFALRSADYAYHRVYAQTYAYELVHAQEPCGCDNWGLPVVAPPGTVITWWRYDESLGHQVQIFPDTYPKTCLDDRAGAKATIAAVNKFFNPFGPDSTE